VEAWQREGIALIALFLFLLIGQAQVTVQDADCLHEQPVPEEIIPFSDQELDVALTAGQVTADQCVYMESAGIDWQIDIKR